MQGLQRLSDASYLKQLVFASLFRCCRKVQNILVVMEPFYQKESSESMPVLLFCFGAPDIFAFISVLGSSRGKDIRPTCRCFGQSNFCAGEDDSGLESVSFIPLKGEQTWEQ